MDDDKNQNRRLLLATVLSMGVLLLWYTFVSPPPPVPAEPPATASQSAPDTDLANLPPAAAGDGAPPTLADTPIQSRDVVLDSTPRVVIDTKRLMGSISLIGGRIDDLELKDYRETVDPDSPLVTLLSPAGAPDAYYALYGWSPAGGIDAADLPNAKTEWAVDGNDVLGVDTPVTLVWDNGRGLAFRRVISLDDNYMFSIRQEVTNTGTSPVRLAPYGIVARHGEPDVIGFFVLHEGVIRSSDGTRQYIKYNDMPELEFAQIEQGNVDILKVEADGWVGFTDRDWMTTLVSLPGTGFTSVAKYAPGGDIYQTEMRLPIQEVAPGATVGVDSMLFAGAKEWELLRFYQNQPNWLDKLLGGRVDPDRPQIDRFIEAIDWGWFAFLTKPIFRALHWLNALIGNMGWAIIGLTFVIKAILFPLAYKSYAAMARMKELQPELEKLKERAGDDRQKLQTEMMELYKKEKVNPAAGCLPILFQIPIFFSLYKVIFVTIELRHAPWLGPFRDLSAPDPTSLFNLFGLLPWGAPAAGTVLALIFIGILPLLLGISMWLQQKLNPAPTDPTQAQIFAWMPWIFMFMLGHFASGLVLYWITNNVITFGQQYAIMRSHGYKPDVFGNIKQGVKRKKPAAKPADEAKPADTGKKPKPSGDK